MPPPQLAILTLTESFQELWSKLIPSTGARFRLAASVAELGGLGGACGLVIAAGAAGALYGTGTLIGAQNQLIARTAPAFTGRAAQATELLTRPGMVGRAARGAQGMGEGVLFDAATAESGQRAENIGLGAGLGGAIGFLLPPQARAAARAAGEVLPDAPRGAGLSLPAPVSTVAPQPRLSDASESAAGARLPGELERAAAPAIASGAAGYLASDEEGEGRLRDALGMAVLGGAQRMVTRGLGIDPGLAATRRPGAEAGDADLVAAKSAAHAVGVPGGAAEDAPAMVRPHAAITQEAQSYGRHGFGVRVPDEQAREFTDEVHGAYVDEDGTHFVDRLVSQKFGRPVQRRQVQAEGWWGGDKNPNTDFEFDADIGDDEVRYASALHGLTEGQDGVAWYRRLPEQSAEGNPGYVIFGENGRALTPEAVEDLRQLVNSSEKYEPLRGAHVREGVMLFRNFTDVPEETYDRLLREALEEVDVTSGGAHHYDVQIGSFSGELLNGPSAYLKALGRDADALRQARQLLLERVGPVYERWAERVGADAEAVRARIRERVEALDALLHQVENPPPRGNKKGVAVGAAARNIFESLRDRFAPVPESQPLEQRVGALLPRLSALADEFVEEHHIPPDMALDWYKGAAGNQRAILRLIQPELAEKPRHIIATFIHSILSNGQQVPNEVRAGANVVEQYLKTGRISLLDSSSRYYRTPLERGAKKDGTPKIVPQNAFEGRWAEGIDGETIFGSPRALSHEASLRRLQNLIATAGEEETANILLGSRKLKNGDIRFAATELFGPKIGQYALDKLGIASGGSTIDLWMARLYYALTGIEPKLKKNGDLDDTVTPEMRRTMQALLREFADQRGATPSSAQALAWYVVKNLYRKAGAKEKAGAYSTLASAAADVVTTSGKANTGAARMGQPKTTDRVAGPEIEGWGKDAKLRAVARREGFEIPRDERGQPLYSGVDLPRALQTPGGRTAAGAGAGAAIGGAADAASGEDDSSLDGTLLGAAAGAGAVNLPAAARAVRGKKGGVVGPGGDVSGAGGASATADGLTDEQIEEIMQPVRAGGAPAAAGQAPPTPPAAGAPAGAGSADVDPEDYVNIAKFAQDPAGEQILKDEVKRMVEKEGLAPKEVIGWKETIAKSLGLSADDIEAKTAGEMGRVEALAARNIITSNIDEIKRVSEKLADANITAEQQERLTSALNALEAQNEALLSKFTRARSEAGRTLNSYKILANRTLDPATWLSKAKNLAGSKYDDEVRAQVLGFINKGDRAGLVKYMAGLRRSTFGEKVVTGWKAGLLTNPITHLINFSGNLVHGAFLAMAETPSAFYDWALGLATGQRTKTGLSATTLAAAGRGALQGAKEAKMVLQGIPLEDALKKYDIPKETNYDSKVFDLYTKAIFRSLSATDRVFRGAALQASLAEQAQVLAKAEGLRGDALKKRVAELQKQPTEAMAIRAIDAAERATFQNNTRAYQALRGFTKPLGHFGSMVAPFQRTPSAVATAVVEYSPFGMAAGAVNAGQVLTAALRGKRVAAKDQLRAAERLGRSATGMAPIAVGYFLYKQGLATGSYSTEAEKRNQNELEQRPPSSVLIRGKWYNTGRLSPVGNLIALGANMAAAGEDEASLGERVFQTGASAVKTVADQPMLTGVQDVTDALTDPQRFAGSYFENLVGSAVPAGVAAVSRAMDDTVRRPDGPVDILKSRTPVLSKTVTPKVTALGDEVKRSEGAISQILNPLQPRADVRESDPLVKELSRVGASREVSPLRRVKGTTAEEHVERQKRYGRKLRQVLEKTVRSVKYTSLPQQAERAVRTNPKYRGMDPAELAKEKQRELVAEQVRRIRNEFSEFEEKARKRAAERGQ